MADDVPHQIIEMIPQGWWLWRSTFTPNTDFHLLWFRFLLNVWTELFEEPIERFIPHFSPFSSRSDFSKKVSSGFNMRKCLPSSKCRLLRVRIFSEERLRPLPVPGHCVSRSTTITTGQRWMGAWIPTGKVGCDAQTKAEHYCPPLQVEGQAC